MKASTYRLRVSATGSARYRRQVRRRIVNALQKGDRRIVVDCGAWTQLDLLVLSEMVCCANACGELGAEFEMENLEHELRSRICALHLSDRLGMRG